MDRDLHVALTRIRIALVQLELVPPFHFPTYLEYHSVDRRT